jgi:glycosyltransferase involved in cell wall biosynthesis
MELRMKVSILVINYNYGRYLQQVVDSALAQTWADKEVVVVDNGSTDDSWTRLQAYGDRVNAVRVLDNRGVVTGYNAGFENSDGHWLMFLDADDLLDPDAIETMMKLVTPEVAKVQFRMRHMDRDGKVIPGVVPYLLHDGDVRPLIRRFGHYAGPPGSGNLYRRSAIARYFPLPVDAWNLGADTVPFALSAFHGRVASAPRELGAYRLHWRNSQTRGVLGNNKLSLAEAYLYDAQIRTRVLTLLRERSGIVVDGPFVQMPNTVRKRALSWKLRPDEHPHRDETRWGLLRLQAQALREWPGFTATEKLVQWAWLAALLVAPRPAALRLADGNTAGSVRRWLRSALHRDERAPTVLRRG